MLDNLEPQLKPLDIASFDTFWHGYPRITNEEGSGELGQVLEAAFELVYNEDDKYPKYLAPVNKLDHLPYPDMGVFPSVCWGKVLNPGLEDYYIIELINGWPHPVIIVHKDDLITSRKELERQIYHSPS